MLKKLGPHISSKFNRYGNMDGCNFYIAGAQYLFRGELCVKTPFNLNTVFRVVLTLIPVSENASDAN